MKLLISKGASGPDVTRLAVDPQLQLFRSGVATAIATNNDWGGTAALQSAFSQVGAFSLSPNSKDAALLMTLPPGNYSAQAVGANNAGGMMLVEVYEVN